MTVSLKEIIANNRRNVLKNNRRDASVAIDIYVNAQDIMPGSNESDLQELRKNLNKRIDLSNHWADLGGDAPLLLLTYSDKAEGIM
jgi:ribosomal protein S3